MSQTEITPEMSPASQAAIQRSIEIALEAVQKDKTLRVPRTEEDRANGFAGWLARKREQHEPMMQTAVTEAFANVAPLDEITVKKYVECYVWPEAEHWLLHYFALRGQASWWVSHNHRETTTIGLPEAQGELWRIPLGVHNIGENLGQVILDRDGSILPELSTADEQLTERVRDRRLSPA